MAVQGDFRNSLINTSRLEMPVCSRGNPRNSESVTHIGQEIHGRYCVLGIGPEPGAVCEDVTNLTAQLQRLIEDDVQIGIVVTGRPASREHAIGYLSSSASRACCRRAVPSNRASRHQLSHASRFGDGDGFTLSFVAVASL